MDHLRLIVESPTDAMTTEFPHHAEVIGFRMTLNRVADVTQAGAGTDRGRIDGGPRRGAPSR